MISVMYIHTLYIHTLYIHVDVLKDFWLSHYAFRDTVGTETFDSITTSYYRGGAVSLPVDVVLQVYVLIQDKRRMLLAHFTMVFFLSLSLSLTSCMYVCRELS